MSIGGVWLRMTRSGCCEHRRHGLRFSDGYGNVQDFLSLLLPECLGDDVPTIHGRVAQLHADN